MTRRENRQHDCAICGRTFSARDLTSARVLSAPLSATIARDHAHWSSESYVCRPDLARLRAQHVHGLLESEKGELTSLEEEVLASLREHELIAEDLESESQSGWTLGERLADKVADFGGSWAFLISFGAFLVLWIGVNSLLLLWRPVDPYPFILLNLLLSCLAAVQAPIIMMSQHRQEAKDRVRSQHDYKVNLKAELEIRHLHEKVDHLLSHQWERLFEIQELQIELLSELGQRR